VHCQVRRRLLRLVDEIHCASAVLHRTPPATAGTALHHGGAATNRCQKPDMPP
jgi:hypothetical protein